MKLIDIIEKEDDIVLIFELPPNEGYQKESISIPKEKLKKLVELLA